MQPAAKQHHGQQRARWRWRIWSWTSLVGGILGSLGVAVLYRNAEWFITGAVLASLYIVLCLALRYSQYVAVWREATFTGALLSLFITAAGLHDAPELTHIGSFGRQLLVSLPIILALLCTMFLFLALQELILPKPALRADYWLLICSVFGLLVLLAPVMSAGWALIGSDAIHMVGLGTLRGIGGALGVGLTELFLIMVFRRPVSKA